jgi:hypothetical protein
VKSHHTLESANNSETDRLVAQAHERKQEVIEKPKTYPYFDDVPDELIHYIATFLELKEIIAFSEVNKRMNETIRNLPFKKSETQDGKISYRNILYNEALQHTAERARLVKQLERARKEIGAVLEKKEDRCCSRGSLYVGLFMSGILVCGSAINVGGVYLLNADSIVANIGGLAVMIAGNAGLACGGTLGFSWLISKNKEKTALLENKINETPRITYGSNNKA